MAGGKGYSQRPRVLFSPSLIKLPYLHCHHPSDEKHCILQPWMCLDEGLESVAIVVTNCVNTVIALLIALRGCVVIQIVQHVVRSNSKVTVSSVT